MRSLAVLMLLVAVGFAAANDKPAWQQNYEQGLQLQAQGHYEEAASFFKMSVADKPISEILTLDGKTLEYLPYLQLGICYYRTGKISLAHDFLELEDSLPAVSGSKAGRSLLTEYKQLVRKNPAAVSAPGAADENAIRSYTRKPTVLSEADVSQLKEDIRQQCNLPRTEEHSYPWYYHYELGLALETKKDWQRALDSFLGALDLRDRPQRLTRIYGMWFRDYYPYYNIGLAHYQLGNWKCAATSFRLSRMFEDLPKNSMQYRQLEQMKEEAERNLARDSSGQ